MKRRHFIQTTATTAIAGLISIDQLTAQVISVKPIDFLQEQQENNMLYPHPLDGQEVEITPAGLSWFPAPGSSGYRVVIENTDGKSVYEAKTGDDPAHLPSEVLEPGAYHWNVFALNDQGEQVAERGKKSFIIAENVPELPWQDPEELLSKVSREHSRILYPKNMLPEIKKAIKGPRRKAWQQLYQKAVEALDTPPPTYPTYHLLNDPKERRLSYVDYFQYFRKYIDNALKHLSLAYLVSGEKRFAESAKRILLEVAGWSTDDKDVTSLRAEWGDEAGLSLAKYGHKAYDWLYDSFTDAEKEKVYKMCEERAAQAYRHLKEGHNYITYPGSNHDSRTITFLVEMAVALAHEAKDAPKWLDYGLRACATVYPHWAGQDGGWGNGLPYSVWYNDLYVSPFVSLKDQTGFDLWQRPFFRKFRNFYLYCSTPVAEIGPFGDASERTAPAAGSASSFSSLMWFHAHHYQDPYAGWWANQTPAIDEISNDYTLLYDAKAPEKKPVDIPHSSMFRGIGWAALHSDLADPANDNFLLFKSSPYGSVSHNHADQNSFAIMSGGKALAIPGGYYGPAYGQPHHADYTRATISKNSVLVNGEGQVKRSKDAYGKIVKFEEHPGMTYVAGDATAAYDGKLKFIRHVVLLRPSVFIVLDELEADQPANFQWLLHAFDKMEIGANTIVSSRAGKQLKVSLFSPVEFGITQTDQFAVPFNEGIPPEFQEEVENQWHVNAETKSKQRKLRIAAVMEVGNENVSPEVSIEPVKDWLTVNYQGESGKAEAWINLDQLGELPVEVAKKGINQQTLISGQDITGRQFKI